MIVADLNKQKMIAKKDQKRASDYIKELNAFNVLDGIELLNQIDTLRSVLVSLELADKDVSDVKAISIFHKKVNSQISKLDNEVAELKKTATLLVTVQHEVNMVGFNDNKRETTDDEAIRVIKKFIKNNTDTIGFMIADAGGKLGSKDISKEKELRAENHLLELFLPSQMSTEALTDVIFNHVAENPEIKMGQIMQFLKKNYDGLYDGKVASSIAKEALV